MNYWVPLAKRVKAHLKSDTSEEYEVHAVSEDRKVILIIRKGEFVPAIKEGWVVVDMA